MKLILKPIPPFDFDLSASIFSDGDEQIRKYEDGKYWQVIRINDKLILIVVKDLGAVDEPKLLVELKSDKKISNSDKNKAKKIIHSLFNLKIDLEPFYEEVKKDKIISKLAIELRGLRSSTTSTVFEALTNAIIGQQISLKVAHSMQRNMIKSFGDILKLNEKIYYTYPTSQKLASLGIEQLRKCGLSLRKSEYVRDISKLVINKKLDLDKLRKNENIQEIISELDKIRGIGVWTAEITMIRGMQKFEAMPADDLGVRRYISHYYCKDRKISSEEVRKIADKWGRWKGLAIFYLIMAGRLGLKI